MSTIRPAGLSPQQTIMLDHLRHTRGSPLPVARFVEALYGARADGGPVTADNVVRVQMLHLRRWLAGHGVAVLTIGLGRGSEGYMLDPGHLERLEAVLATQDQAAIDIARAS